MKECYFRQLSDIHLAIADVVHWGHVLVPGWLITRINVPRQFRGQGVGTALLKEIMTDADAARQVLLVEPMASDGLSQRQLELWYGRHCFIRSPTAYGLWVRQPGAARISNPASPDFGKCVSTYTEVDHG